MKKESIAFSNWRRAVRMLFVVIAFTAASLVTAQNFVKNPDFEGPLGPDNWTVVYAPSFGGAGTPPTNCGPFDFLFAGRSTLAHKDMAPGTWDGDPNYWSKFGGHFAPNHTWRMHAYFRQVVTNLTPGAYYAVSAWMAAFSGNQAHVDKCNIYMEAIGAMGSQTSPYPAANVLNCYNNMAAGWQRYTVTNRANGAGQIEIRLHFNKFASIGSFVNNYWEYRNLNAFFDHVALMPVGQTEYAPQPTILSCIRSGPDIELTWASVMNNIYRLQYCKDLANPSSWAWVTWSPKLDTNLYATGPTCTFQTNLLCLFSFDPTFDPDDPLFFRIYSRGYQP